MHALLILSGRGTDQSFDDSIHDCCFHCQVTIIGKNFTDVYFENRERALQEKVQRAAADAAAKTPAGVCPQPQHQQADKASVVVSEEALAAAIQQQLCSVAIDAGKSESSSSTLPPPLPAAAKAPLPVAAAAEPVVSRDHGSAAAADSGQEQQRRRQQEPLEASAGSGSGVGLRRRVELTSLIREQLVHMVRTAIYAWMWMR